ncbi:hypothetical protein AB0N77_21185 [Streptomyces misionensis]|uniref:hypothetical protein n=1 Tax=Streptomyces misionensis TaxID=67331 RepID=UPI00344792B7
MPTLCRVSPSATTVLPADSHPEPRDQPARPALADVLDLQETEVPRTAHALEHFFPEA